MSAHHRLGTHASPYTEQDEHLNECTDEGCSVAFRRCGLHATCVLLWTRFGKHQGAFLEDSNGYTAWDRPLHSPRLLRQTWAMATPTPTWRRVRVHFFFTFKRSKQVTKRDPRNGRLTKTCVGFSLRVSPNVCRFAPFYPLDRFLGFAPGYTTESPATPWLVCFLVPGSVPHIARWLHAGETVVAHPGSYQEEAWLSGFVFQAASACPDVKVAAINDAFTPIGYMVYNSHARVHGRWRSCSLTSSTARPRQYCRSERSWPMIVFKHQSSYTGTAKTVHQVIFESGCTDMGIVSTDLVTSPMLPTILEHSCSR